MLWMFFHITQHVTEYYSHVTHLHEKAHLSSVDKKLASMLLIIKLVDSMPHRIRNSDEKTAQGVSVVRPMRFAWCHPPALCFSLSSDLCSAGYQPANQDIFSIVKYCYCICPGQLGHLQLSHQLHSDQSLCHHRHHKSCGESYGRIKGDWIPRPDSQKCLHQ